MSDWFGVCAAVAIPVSVISGAALITDEAKGVRLWLKKRFMHVHEGPSFLVTNESGGPIAARVSFPDEVISWHTCKKDGETYAVRRRETADEFETRTKAAPAPSREAQS